MEKIKVAVVGYGNIGAFAVEAVQAAPDMDLVGVVRRASSVGSSLPAGLANVNVVSDIDDLGKVDVAILCGPTRSIPEVAKKMVDKCVASRYNILRDY